MKYNDIIREIDSIFDYFQFHNRNLTKIQEQKLQELQDFIHVLRRSCDCELSEKWQYCDLSK